MEDFIARVHSIKTRHFVEPITIGKIRPRPGVIRIMQEARQAGCAQPATTTTPGNVRALLKTSFDAHVPTWFEIIAAGDLVARKKPAPDIYHYALDMMGLMPEECLAFDDSENDLRAALAAGIPPIVLVNQYTRDQDFNGAVLVVENLEENEQPSRVISGICGFEQSSQQQNPFETLESIRDLPARSLGEHAMA